MDILSLDHIQLAMPSNQESSAEAFYSGVLGLTRVPKPPTLQASGGAWFERGPVRIHLGVEQDFKPAKKAHPGLVTSDLARALQDLEGAGVPTSDIQTLPGRRRIFFHDPFGNRLELIELI